MRLPPTLEDPPTGYDLLTLKEAGALLRKSPATVYRWAMAGRLRYWLIGRRRHVSRAELLSLLVPGTAAPAHDATPPVPRASRRAQDKYNADVLRRNGLL